MKQFKHISIDWLQFTAYNYCNEFKSVNWKKKDIQTKQFSEVWEYSIENKIFLTACCNPRSTILRKDILVIKVENSELYYFNLIDRIFQVLLFENFKLGNITRLDLAYDFNKFDNEMKAQQLISGFMSNKYLKNGRSKYKLIGAQLLNHKFEYLRFGDNTSNISAYLYNKSKEMKEVKYKAHIHEIWIKNDLDMNKDIWRLEFSLKEFKNILTDKTTGNQLQVNFRDLESQEILLSIFNGLCCKYFDFRINNKLRNKSRMKKLDLFTISESKYIWLSEVNKLDAKRSDKIFINKIDDLNNELRSININLANELQDFKELILYTKNLNDWYNHKHSQPEKVIKHYSKRYSQMIH